LLVVIDTHFDLPPFGTAFVENKHKVLEAIFVVLRRHNVELAIPAYCIVNSATP
jgi:hypothetical protein